LNAIHARGISRLSRQRHPQALVADLQGHARALRDNHVYLQTDRTHFISDKIADIKRWMIDAFNLTTATRRRRYDRETFDVARSFSATARAWPETI
jgi:hypothetical protein